MYIHIGSDRMERVCDIVGIFDLDGEITTEDTKAFLKNADKMGIASLAGKDLPRSFVLISDKDKKEKLIYSRITSSALAERGEK